MSQTEIVRIRLPYDAVWIIRERERENRTERNSSNGRYFKMPGKGWHDALHKAREIDPQLTLKWIQKLITVSICYSK